MRGCPEAAQHARLLGSVRRGSELSWWQICSACRCLYPGTALLMTARIGLCDASSPSAHATSCVYAQRSLAVRSFCRHGQRCAPRVSTRPARRRRGLCASAETETTSGTIFRGQLLGQAALSARKADILSCHLRNWCADAGAAAGSSGAPAKGLGVEVRAKLIACNLLTIIMLKTPGAMHALHAPVQVDKFARSAATTFAPRASGATKNPAYKGAQGDITAARGYIRQRHDLRLVNTVQGARYTPSSGCRPGCSWW